MKVAIIGATGFIGAALLNETLARGHDVTAVMRHPEKLMARPALTIKQGDVFHSAELAGILAGHDVVMSAFNAFGPNAGAEAYDNMLLGTHAIIAAVKRAKVPRLLMVGGAGSLEVAPHQRLVDTPEFPAEWREAARAMTEVLNIMLCEKELNWTLLSPSAFIAPGERTNHFRLGSNQLLVDKEGQSKISTEDYAVAMLDEMENPVHTRQRFTVGY